ncbi:MAG TPA: hypothetical protein VLV45_01695 [Gemmatimonadales bacterium]|nr:hypothetical protein [Gemmatimonadales bacterium]
MKFNYAMRIDWRDKKTPNKKEAIALGGVVAGDSTNGPATEKAPSLPHLRKVFEASNQSRAFTILIRLDTKPYFPKGRAFDFMSIEVDQVGSSNPRILTASIHDVTMTKETKIQVGSDWFDAVTLDMSEGQDFSID